MKHDWKTRDRKLGEPLSAKCSKCGEVAWVKLQLLLSCKGRDAGRKEAS